MMTPKGLIKEDKDCPPCFAKIRCDESKYEQHEYSTDGYLSAKKVVKHVRKAIRTHLDKYSDFFHA